MSLFARSKFTCATMVSYLFSATRPWSLNMKIVTIYIYLVKLGQVNLRREIQDFSMVFRLV